jgi:ABC-type multidrug transport system fused ATPase/permease subunit
MNEFLSGLDNRISVLNEEERKKIIKKFQKEIEKNIKDGMSESEAIEKLGDIDIIVEKIYSDYHINKDFKSDKKSLGQKFNDLIKTCAEFLTEFCQDLIKYAKNNTKDKPLEAFFEILLKILLLIMAFMIIKIPFIIIEEFLAWVFGLLFYPFDYVLSGLSEFVLAILYFICCILLGIATFKNYYNKDEKVIENKKKDNTASQKTEEDNKEIKEETKIYNNYAFLILKIFLYIIVIIPLIFLNIVFLALALFAGFLVFKGVNIIGLAVLLFGLFMLILTVTNYITDTLDNKPKNHTFALIVSVLSLIIGVVLFIDNLFKFNYPDGLDKSRFINTNETTIINIDKKSEITAVDGNITFEVDNNLIDNEILVEVSYYDELIDVVIERYDGKDTNYILLYPTDDNINFKTVRYFYESALEDLKSNNIFNYEDLRKFKVKIFCNEKTKELLK